MINIVFDIIDEMENEIKDKMFIRCSNKRVAYKKCKQLNIEYKDKGYYFYVQKMTKKEKELYKIGR